MADATPPVLTQYKVPADQLGDGNVTLRRWQKEDAPGLLAAAEDALPELKMWMPWAANGYTLKDAESFLAISTAAWDKGREYDYAIVVDGTIAGSCGLMTPALGSLGMGMGYWLATSVTGRGSATKAAALLTQAAFDCGAEVVQVWHKVANDKSRAIPKRLGYRFLGEHDDLQISEPGLMGLWQMDRPAAE